MFCETIEARFLEWIMKQDFEKDLADQQAELKRREENPDWERPIVMYGVRRQGHKCIKKKEIAIIIDKIPWQQRAKTAETHWYHILYKRPANEIEWKEIKENYSNRRYTIFPYFIQKDWSIDKIVSRIVQDDFESYNLRQEIIRDVISAFELFFQRKIRIYRIEKARQLSLPFIWDE